MVDRPSRRDAPTPRPSLTPEQSHKPSPQFQQRLDAYRAQRQASQDARQPARFDRNAELDRLPKRTPFTEYGSYVTHGRGTYSGRACHVEQKFATQMRNDGAHSADLVINNSDGPCGQRLGCSQSLPELLDPDQRLTVHWPDASGVWRQKTYVGR